jgi:hypothetical protein
MSQAHRDSNPKHSYEHGIDPKNTSGKKLQYKAPKLTEYGSMAKLTQGSSSRNGEAASRTRNG